MEVSDEDEEFVLPSVPNKPQKTLFSFFNVDKTVVKSTKTGGKDTKTSGKDTKTGGKDTKSSGKDSGTVKKGSRSSGISASLFGKNAAKKMGRPCNTSKEEERKQIELCDEKEEEKPM